MNGKAGCRASHLSELMFQGRTHANGCHALLFCVALPSWCTASPRLSKEHCTTLTAPSPQAAAKLESAVINFFMEH